MKMEAVCLGIALLLIGTSQGRAADAHQGAALAERWCSGCHVVSAQQKQGTTDVPPFSELADRQSFNPAKVALSLLLPHPPMSGMELSRSDAADLAAYIASQK